MLEPIGNRVIVRPKAPDEKSKSGLLLSKKEEEKQDQGTIISVGIGGKVEDFRKDDVIIYQKYGPAEITVDKEKLVIVHIEEILAREVK